MISQLGRYEIVGELGQGAMGVVYKAKDPLIDRIVAIKTISLGLAMDEKEEYEARFYQEAKAAGRLSHPNIVTVFDVGKSGDVAYIAMEFLEGRELRDILDDGQRLPVGQVLDIVAQVALGLGYAHEHGIVHRDVKPSNIMVVRDGHVKITDFGIARMATSSVRTQTGMILGSPKYMSPEQVLGKPIDQRSDIFSLGVMLYEMLVGKPPFAGDNINAIMYQILNAVPPQPGSLNPEVPSLLNFIVAKALAKGVVDRYQNAREFADDLRACRDALPRSAARADATNPQLSASSVLKAEALSLNSRVGAASGDGKPLANTGAPLPPDFDATMRLSDMSNAAGDADKTIKVVRPGADAVSRPAPETPKPTPKPRSRVIKPEVAARAISTQTMPLKVDRHPFKTGKLLLVAVIMLVLVGLVLAFLH